MHKSIGTDKTTFVREAIAAVNLAFANHRHWLQQYQAPFSDLAKSEPKR